MSHPRLRLLTGLALGLLGLYTLWVSASSSNHNYLPLVAALPPTPTPVPTPTPDPNAMPEIRALWVTRFDWTSNTSPADPARIDEMVANAALAGFNTIYFQVRGAADAYYTPGLEPWAQRVSGVYGQPPAPLWDPLAYFIEQAHAAGLQLHAYLNVYPVWDQCATPPAETVSPRPLYHQLIDEHGVTLLDLGHGPTLMPNGLQWLYNSTELCLGAYNRASPASIFHDDHLVAVASDLANRYALDGLHLDHTRYGSPSTSCDPVSLCRYQGQEPGCQPVPSCNLSDDYQAWQRTQVNGTVRRFYEEVIAAHPQLWFSAAVWPIHTDKWGWGATEGYADYYQDSKAWLAEGSMDSISPMIYNDPPDGSDCPEDSAFWTQGVWETLAADYQAESSGRFIAPGISGSYCDFNQIVWRIDRARELGTAGHALFSYSGLEARGYFDDLAAGPYAQPAVVPSLPWRP